MPDEKHGDITIKRAESSALVASHALYATKDGRVVGQDDPQANELICAAGLPIPQSAVDRYGIKESKAAKREEAEEPKREEKAVEPKREEPAKAK